MPEAVDQIRAAVPLLALRRIVLVFAGLEIQRSPADQQLPLIVGKRELVFPAGFSNRLDGSQVGEEVVRVRSDDLRIVGVWKSWVEQLAVFRAAVVQGAPEIVGRPLPNTGLGIRRDVWTI